MAIDLNKEELLSLTDATKVLAKIDGKGPSSNCIWRWARKGVRGVQLEYLRLGNRICTSREALARFAQRLAEVDEVTRSPIRRWYASDPTSLQRQREIQVAERRLDEADI